MQPSLRRSMLRASALLALACAGPASAQVSVARQVAAPAADIVSGVVRLPDPALSPTVSRAAAAPIVFAWTAEGWIARVRVPVERDGGLALAVLSVDAGAWRVSVGREGAMPRPIEEFAPLERTVQPAGDALPGWMLDGYDLGEMSAGWWDVELAAPRADATHPPAAGWLVSTTRGALRIEAHVTTHELVQGGVIGLVARVTGPQAQAAGARVVLENQGAVSELAMHDDGLHEDGAAGDGLYGALVPDGVHGAVRARVEIAGTVAGGGPFLRTAQLAFPVEARAVFLEGSASTRRLDSGHVSIEIAALPLVPARRLHVSAEVWGTGTRGEAVPVCWLSRMVEPEPDGGAWSLRLALDEGWLETRPLQAPFELRAVRVQDPDTQVVFDRLERIPLALPGPPPAAPLGGRPVDLAMLTGNPAFVAARAPAHAPLGPTLLSPALMLVHGYCSGGSIWPAVDFSQPKLEFLDPGANRTHDQFAQLIDQRAQSQGVTSFGVVAHSQGGAAALHLLTYYQSGLDLAAGPRRIQALASPFQGTPLASLGSFACGVNDNMTTSGAPAWLAGIPTWARAEVYTWTTANSGSACNFLTSLFLSDPEDGTVERDRSVLPGGTNMGHVTGWCHTTGMSNPASYTDHARNLLMNVNAAR